MRYFLQQNCNFTADKVSKAKITQPHHKKYENRTRTTQLPHWQFRGQP
jgi:hypothetical protein